MVANILTQPSVKQDNKTADNTRTPGEQLRAIVYGAAVGDALGVPYEFMARDTFTCTDMVGGGAHRQPKGTFSDDTSLLLATCDSIRHKRKIDVKDMLQRFRRWSYEGAYAIDGTVFDIGSTVATALSEGAGRSDEYSNGNGSLMRIAPLALTNATNKQIAEVSGITHNHSLSKQACITFVRILREVRLSADLPAAIAKNIPDDPRFSFMENLSEMSRDEVSSGGYVMDTLCAALWCALHTNSYEQCVQSAVNLGRDTDTTACVAGALAGALYGQEAIPTKWLSDLRGKDIIESCLFL